MSDEFRLRYIPREGASPEGELVALTSVYRFVLDCHARKKGARPSAPDYARKEISNLSHKRIISKR